MCSFIKLVRGSSCVGARPKTPPLLSSVLNHTSIPLSLQRPVASQCFGSWSVVSSISCPPIDFIFRGLAAGFGKEMRLLHGGNCKRKKTPAQSAFLESVAVLTLLYYYDILPSAEHRGPSQTHKLETKNATDIRDCHCSGGGGKRSHSGHSRQPGHRRVGVLVGDGALFCQRPEAAHHSCWRATY